MLSLRSIIGLTITCLVAGITVFRGAYVGWDAEKLLRQEVGASLATIAEGMAGKVDGDMRARANQVAVLATLDALLDPKTAQRVVDEFHVQDPTSAWVGVVDARGVILAGTDRILVGKDASSRPVFQHGLEGLFVGDVHDAVLLAKLLPNPTGEPMKFVDVAAPVKTPDGRVGGVFAVHYSWSWARDVVRTLLSAVNDRDGLEVFVVAADNVVLLGDDAAIGKPLHLGGIEKARTGALGWGVETWPDGRDYLTGYSAGGGARMIGNLGWTVLVRQPVDAAFAPADAMRMKIILSGGVLAVVFGGLGWLAAGRIARPLQAIADAAERIRQGEPRAAIPRVGGASEIRLLSQALRELITSLRSSNTALAASTAALARMEGIAYQDRLTALPNRRFFEQYLEAALSRARAELSQMAVLYIDLDGFKPVNDCLGHDAGDEVLRQVGLRLASSLRTDDVVARIGGDEFAAVLMLSGSGHSNLQDVPARFIAAINEPILMHDHNGQDHTVRVGCSIGVAVWPLDGVELTTVLKRADEALYRAKRLGKNRAIRYADMTDDVAANDDDGDMALSDRALSDREQTASRS